MKTLIIILFMTFITNSNSYELVIKKSESPIISFRIQFKIGSINDWKKQEGINALTASLIAQGGTKFLTYNEVVEKLYPWAGEIYFIADKELTTFIGSVHKDNLEGFYKIFSDLILNPRFDEEDFARVKDENLNFFENNLRSINDEDLGKQVLQTMIYKNHPYEKHHFGTVEGIKSIILDDVKKYYNENYTQENLVIGITGNISKEIINEIDSDFKKISLGKFQKTLLPKTEEIQDMEITIVEKSARATAISIGFPISVTRSDKDFYALMVANSYFGEHRTFNGVLMNKIRGDRGINYGDYSYIENFIQDGGTRFFIPNVARRQQFFSIWIRPTKPEDAHFSLRLAMKELKSLCESGISKEEFENARDFVINYSKLWAQTQSRSLGFELDSKFYKADYFIDKIEEELKQLSVDDVNSAIRKYLQYQNVKVAIICQNANELKEKILTNATSQIKYSTTVDESILREDESIINYSLNINKNKLNVLQVNQLFKK